MGNSTGLVVAEMTSGDHNVALQERKEERRGCGGKLV